MFEEMISQYQYWINRTAAKWTPSFAGTIEDFEDLEQEIKMSIFEKYNLYDKKLGSWYGFFRKTVKNKMIDLLHYNKKSKRYLIPEEIFELDRTETVGQGEVILSVEKLEPRLSLWGEMQQTPLSIILFKEFYDLLYKRIGKIKHTPTQGRFDKTKSFAQCVFSELTSPSEELIKIAKKRVDYNNNPSSKRKLKITEIDLAILFKTTIPTIRRSLKLIRIETKKALKHEGYDFLLKKFVK